MNLKHIKRDLLLSIVKKAAFLAWSVMLSGLMMFSSVVSAQTLNVRFDGSLEASKQVMMDVLGLPNAQVIVGTDYHLVQPTPYLNAQIQLDPQSPSFTTIDAGTLDGAGVHHYSTPVPAQSLVHTPFYLQALEVSPGGARATIPKQMAIHPRRPTAYTSTENLTFNGLDAVYVRFPFAYVWINGITYYGVWIGRYGVLKFDSSNPV